MITLLNTLFPRPNCARNGIQSTTTFKFPLQGVLRLKEVLDKKASFLSSFRPARARRVCTSEHCSPGLFSSWWTVSKEILFYALWWQKCMLPIDLVFPPFPVLKTCKHEWVVVVWFMFSSFSLLLFALQWMFLFCFVYVIVLYFSNFLYVSFWFFVFYPISLLIFLVVYFWHLLMSHRYPFLFRALYYASLFSCLFFCLLLSSLSFTTTLFFCCFHSRLKSPKNQSICSKKMEEPLNTLTIGPEQMNKCSGENTLLALKN